MNTRDYPPGCQGNQQHDGRSTHTISVIIPTWNEAERIGTTIASARIAGFDEVIVVDGGSWDDTVSAASAADRVLVGPAGRAVQQNLGASAATGEILLFLHADCQLQPGSASLMRIAMSRSVDVDAGCFMQQIASTSRVYRWLEWGNLHRVLWFQLAYGDQGIFIRRSLFEDLGQFPSWPLMEDVGLMQRLRGRCRFIVLDLPLVVSPRRWRHQGVLRQTLLNWTLLVLFFCGMPPSRLARMYARVR